MTGHKWYATSGAQGISGRGYSGNEKGGSRCTEIGAYLLGCGKISPAIRVRDMGPEPAYAEGAGRIPP